MSQRPIRMTRKIARGVLFSALKWLAKLTVNKYSPFVVAVTGSVGKTTAKEMIAHVLSAKYVVAKTPQNANTEWAVVATLISPSFVPTMTLDEKAKVTLGQAIRLLFIGLGQLFVVSEYPEVLVLELAADRPKDISLYNSILQYDVAVLTNIGQVHLEFYKNQEALTQEKWSIVRGLKPSGILIANGDNDLIKPMLKDYAQEKISFGLSENNDYYADAHQSQNAKMTTKFHTPAGTFEANLPLGRQLVLGAMPAVIVAKIKGMSETEIVDQLNSFKALGGRFEVHKLTHGITLINDAYNANPDSMKSAILSMQDIARGRKVVILGGMAELGVAHIKAHQDIGEFVAGRVDLAIFIGEDGKLMADTARGSATEVKVLPEAEKREILALLRDNDTILVKASRAYGLNAVADAIKESFK